MCLTAINCRDTLLEWGEWMRMTHNKIAQSYFNRIGCVKIDICLTLRPLAIHTGSTLTQREFGFISLCICFDRFRLFVWNGFYLSCHCYDYSINYDSPIIRFGFLFFIRFILRFWLDVWCFFFLLSHFVFFVFFYNSRIRFIFNNVFLSFATCRYIKSKNRQRDNNILTAKLLLDHHKQPTKWMMINSFVCGGTITRAHWSVCLTPFWKMVH